MSLDQAKWVFAALALSAAPALAQTQISPLVGQWQGVFHTNEDVRTVISLHEASGKIQGESFLVDRGLYANISTVEINGDRLRLPVGNVTFEGVVSADNKSISGRMKQGNAEGWPITLEKVSAKAAWIAPHVTRMIQVEPGVELEVLDWGGTGRPLIFLSGSPGTAHNFDKFAPMFLKTHRVYAISRRGMGKSSRPAAVQTNYTQDRLGDDILAVMDALKVDRAVLAGWSFAGSEMSNIGTRKPERVAGLIYLDAAFDYAFYAPGIAGPNNLLSQTADLREKAEKLIFDIAMNGATPEQRAATLSEMQTGVAQLQADLKASEHFMSTMPAGPPRSDEVAKVATLMNAGVKKYPAVTVPVLAIYAGEQKTPPNAPAAALEEVRVRNERNAILARRFQEGNPSAKVVILTNATHNVFQTQEAVVFREMNAFLSRLSFN